MSVTKGKVALVTGGAVGIGLEFTKSLLSNGAKGVIVADINPEWGKKAVEELSKQFGKDKIAFIATDVSDKNQLEGAFKKAIEVYNQLDIVINNAGILNEKNYYKMISINCNAVVDGTYLAMEKYLPKYKSGSEGIIVNIASLYGLDYNVALPVYSGTKFFVLGFSQAIGNSVHYERTKVRVLTICPGITETLIVSTANNNIRDSTYEDILKQELQKIVVQKPSHLGKELITVLEKGSSGSAWLIERSEPAAEVTTPERFSRLKK